MPRKGREDPREILPPYRFVRTEGTAGRFAPGGAGPGGRVYRFVRASPPIHSHSRGAPLPSGSLVGNSRAGRVPPEKQVGMPLRRSRFVRTSVPTRSYFHENGEIQGLPLSPVTFSQEMRGLGASRQKLTLQVRMNRQNRYERIGTIKHERIGSLPTNESEGKEHRSFIGPT